MVRLQGGPPADPCGLCWGAADRRLPYLPALLYTGSGSWHQGGSTNQCPCDHPAPDFPYCPQPVTLLGWGHNALCCSHLTGSCRATQSQQSGNCHLKPLPNLHPDTARGSEHLSSQNTPFSTVMKRALWGRARGRLCTPRIYTVTQSLHGACSAAVLTRPVSMTGVLGSNIWLQLPGSWNPSLPCAYVEFPGHLPGSNISGSLRKSLIAAPRNPKQRCGVSFLISQLCKEWMLLYSVQQSCRDPALSVYAGFECETGRICFWGQFSKLSRF